MFPYDLAITANICLMQIIVLEINQFSLGKGNSGQRLHFLFIEHYGQQRTLPTTRGTEKIISGDIVL